MLLLAAAGRPTTTAVPLEEQVRELQAGEHRCCKGQAVRGRRFEAVSCYEPMEMLPKTSPMLPAEDGNATSGRRRIYQPGIGDARSVGQRCCRRCSGLLTMVVFRIATSVTLLYNISIQLSCSLDFDTHQVPLLS